MSRWFGLLNIAQAGVLVAIGDQYLLERWAPAGWIFVAVAVIQLAGGVALLIDRGPRVARIASALTLAAAAFVVGLHLQVGVHIIRSFNPNFGGEQGWELLGGVLAALPWVSFFPVWQLIASRPSKLGGGGAVAGVLIALLLPPALTWSDSAPTKVYAELDGPAAARFAWAAWQGEPATAPSGAGPVAVAVTVMQRGEPVETVSAQGDDLAAALAALRFTTPPDADAALLVDAALWEAPLARPALMSAGRALARPGDDGFRGPKGLIGTAGVWRGDAAGSRQIFEGLYLPVVNLAKVDDGTGPISHRVRMKTWLVSAQGVSPVKATWAAPLPLTAENALAAAIAGGHFIAENMQADGRYAYIVKGPSGAYGAGYNFPRHAGGSWFLARLHQRTGDEEVRSALLRGLDFMKRNTVETDDGRAFILDPTRRDGKVWVGTTGLGLLAFIEAGVDPELQAKYAAFIASAVDADGKVRGDMDQETGTWPEQYSVTYAQGQGLLALASAERAGLPGVTEALDRAAAYVDSGYWPLPAGNFKTLDDHWMCLAAAAVGEVRDTPSGEAVCQAYLAEVARNAPTPGEAYAPPAGPAAGLAEAVIALAELDRRAGRRTKVHQRALDYGELLLSNLYQPADAPLLARPDRLVGGFRDRPWTLDVQVDAVQHIACALLGVEQLLRDEALPGAMP